jgi:hypothetical protein
LDFLRLRCQLQTRYLETPAAKSAAEATPTASAFALGFGHLSRGHHDRQRRHRPQHPA